MFALISSPATRCQCAAVFNADRVDFWVRARKRRSFAHASLSFPSTAPSPRNAEHRAQFLLQTKQLPPSLLLRAPCLSLIYPSLSAPPPRPPPLPRPLRALRRASCIRPHRLILVELLFLLLLLLPLLSAFSPSSSSSSSSSSLSLSVLLQARTSGSGIVAQRSTQKVLAFDPRGFSGSRSGMVRASAKAEEEEEERLSARREGQGEGGLESEEKGKEEEKEEGRHRKEEADGGICGDAP